MANGIFQKKGLTLLWENINKTTAFAAQTISLDLTPYTAVMITFVANAPAQGGSDLLAKGTLILPVGEFGWFMTSLKYSTSFYNYERKVTVNSDGIIFDVGYANAGRQQDNNFAVPIYIHGIL